MPSGKTHDAITIYSAPVPTIGAYLITNSIPLSLIVGGSHIISGLWLSPDLDTDSIIHKRWRSLGLGWIWIPYRDLVPHRGISHTPLIGTISRIWILIPLFYFAYLLTDRQSFIKIFIVVFTGLESGAFCHYVPDLLITEKKKLIRKLKNVSGVRKRRR